MSVLRTAFRRDGAGSLAGLSARANGSEDVEASEDRTSTETKCPPGCVLVVEDEALICRAMVRLLQGWGYTTLEALDGGAALDQVGSWGDRLSMVLLDIMPPVLSGVEIARQVRAEWPDLPIVACSAGFNATLEADLRRLGVWGILAKPFRAEVLHAIVFHVAQAKSPSQ